MKLLSAAIIFLASTLQAFAHEGEAEMTNLGEADWWGPIIAIVIIVLAIIIAKVIHKRSQN